MQIEYPILAIDYGDKHFGLAISDSKGIIASPLEVISITKSKNRETIIEEILELANEYRAKSILVGMPEAFIQSQQKTVQKIQNFIKLLSQKTKLPIITYDESFSTTRAQNVLISSGQNTKGSRRKIDKIAATVFLQEFLNSETKNNEKNS